MEEGTGHMGKAHGCTGNATGGITDQIGQHRQRSKVSSAAADQRRRERRRAAGFGVSECQTREAKTKKHQRTADSERSPQNA